MAGSKTLKNPGNGGVRVREAEYAGAPMRVSDDTKIRNVSTPKSARKFQQSPQIYAYLADRPSTSGGVSTRKAIEKRGTKDDLHVSPFRVNHFNTTYYNFPLPNSVPTPAATARSSSSRTYSPDISEPEVGSNNAYPPMEIGMALGSPTWRPTVWSPHVQPQAPVREDTLESLEEWRTSAQSAKPKASKWKILGGLFGRKSSESSVEFYQVQTGVQTTVEPGIVTSPPVERTRGRARTNSIRKISKYKPEMQGANTMRTDFQFQEPERPKVPPKGPKEFPIFHDIQTPEIQLDGGPLLDVEIPSIEMERYSVMFGSVIKPNTSASSLLARRQATLDRLKVVNEKIAEHERQNAEAKSKFLRPRRVTSPQPTRSPAISLFPTASRTREGLPQTLRKASLLHRSNTSPAALSPNRQTFEPLRPHYEEHAIMLAPTPTFTSPWSADESYIALESPSSDISLEEVHDPVPLKPRLTEPKWEMVSPRTVTNENNMKVKPLKFTPTPDTKLHQLQRKQSLQSSLDALARAGAKEEAEELIRTAADVSIARQISMSRRQRQLLVPIKSRIAIASSTAREKEEAEAAAEGLLINEKKSMTPRLVNIEARQAIRSGMGVIEMA